ncbi:MAG: hypothetical protein COB30_009555 [Ectothiorhodospiraceae bacterium]|nr:hypothetical protein [Ectothiorhodospiraceae bacterium]
MDQLLKNLVRYLSEVTGLAVIAKPMNSDNLPYFLVRQYALYQLTIGGTPFTAAFLQEEADFKPAQFLKHMRKVPSVKVNELCIVAQSLPTYVRKRLIEKGISFVIPSVQMYLPALGMDLRSRAVRQKPLTVDRFSPATQVVLICWLLGRIEGDVTPLELSKRLEYSAMTMSRAVDELEVSKVAYVERSGRERRVSFAGDRQAIWAEVWPRMRNPVSRVVRIFENKLPRENAVPAGITALSLRTLLNEPVCPEYAISRDTWKAMDKAGVDIIPVEEPGTCLLQVWCYAPKHLQVDEGVDPFSLFLSLQGTNDERIEMALEDMMGQLI